MVLVKLAANCHHNWKDACSNALLNIYYTLILLHLNYGLMVWCWKSNRLITLQKRAVRIIYQEPKSECAEFTELCALQEYKFCFKFEHSILPYYFIAEMKNYFQKRTHGYLVRHII